MPIKQDRQIIGYENVALLVGDAPAYIPESNSGDSLSFLPLVQSINFSFNVERKNASAIGSKNIIDSSNRNAPDVNFNINTLEDFGVLFSSMFEDENFIGDSNLDKNFYAIIGDKKGYDVSGENLSERDFLSFGNCFLENVSISQSINGLMNSEYSFVGSNVQAQQLIQNGNIFSGRCPAINLTGDQSQGLNVEFGNMTGYYSNKPIKIIPAYSTSVTISGNNSIGNFLIESDCIQNFNLNIPINKKAIYSLGKKYPVFRKTLFPNIGKFDFSNKVSTFEVGGDRANLKDFLNTDENYTLMVSGSDFSSEGFLLKITDAKLDSQDISSSISEEIVSNLSFSFDANNIFRRNLSKPYLKTENNEFLLTQNNDYIILEQS